MAPTAKSPGMKDVAKHAGVALGTVSNVLHRPDAVSPKIRERVEDAITELGYIPNLSAQSLRSGLSPLVGVAVLDLTNPFFMEAATGMERRFADAGCVMALSSTHSDVAEEDRLLRTLAGQGVRGILLTPTDSALTAAQQVVKRGVPVVLFDSPEAPATMSSVSVDDRAGAQQAISHLRELGHERLAFLNGPLSARQARDRLDGVHTAAEGADLRVIELPAFTAEVGRAAIGQLLEDLPTGIFCANDLIAFGAMTALREAGVSIPKQVSLVGFDDIAVASHMAVPLTTVRQPMEELGWAAADLLLGAGSAVRHETFFPELVVRASTGPAPR